MKHTLEGKKFFSALAWITVIGFAGFVIHFTLSIQDELSVLEAQTLRTDTSLNDL